jgi:hypothetical protein
MTRECFHDDPNMTIGLRYFTFLAETITQLRENLQQNIIEQQDIFGGMIGNRCSQRRITHIVADYHRQYRMHNDPVSTSSSSSDDPISKMQRIQT